MNTLFARLLSILVLVGCSDLADAAVASIEVLDRQPVAGGAAFGAAGSYEKIRGRALFSVDPNAPANKSIADLALAPRDAQGAVQFSAEFLLLRPTDPARANGT